MSYEPTWGPNSRVIPWNELPRVPGRDDTRIVDGAFMGREQYETEGWRLEVTYTVEHPHRRGCTLTGSREVGIWRASRQGIERYAERRANERLTRRIAYQERLAEEDEFRAYVDELHDVP